MRARVENVFNQALNDYFNSATNANPVDAESNSRGFTATDIKALRSDLESNSTFSDLLRRFEDLKKKHEVVLKAECKRLTKSFAINRWRVN